MKKKNVLGTIKTYLHGSKDENWEMIEELKDKGFFKNMDETEIEIFSENFIYTNYEVELELEVYKNGNSEIIAVNGKKL
jgi:hypothetical protein